MSNKTREALEYIEDSLRFPMSDEVRGNLEKACDALATPSTEQTGRVISDDLYEDLMIILTADGETSDRFSDALRDSPRIAPAVILPSEEDIRGVFLKRGYTRTSFQDELVSDISSLLTDRLGKPAEVDLSRWAKTQGFDAWADDHAAVLRNLKAYLKAEGVRVKE